MAEGLSLSDTQLSWAGQDTGLVATYEQLREKVAALLTQGVGETDKIAEITTTLDKIRDKMTQLQSSINSGLASLPSWAGSVGNRVIDAWSWFCRQADRFWSWITNITSHMGSPTSLSLTADSWSSGVGGPVSG